LEGRDYLVELAVLNSAAEELIVSALGGLDGAQDFLERARDCTDESLRAARAAATPEDIGVIVYTSGTTRQPKGAMLSHRAIVAAALANVRWMGDGLERAIGCRPINHVGAPDNLYMSVFVYGGALVFRPGFDLEEYCEVSKHERMGYQGASPTGSVMFQADPAVDLEILRLPRLIVIGGAKTPSHLLVPLLSLGAGLSTVYGQTETCGTVTRADLDAGLEVMSETIGNPLPSVGLLVWHFNGRECADGEHGELQVRGPNLMSGNFQRPEATAEAFTEDECLRTGDLGYRRADGNFVFVGRLKEIFTSGGYNVYPVGIDLAICEHPDVVNAAVLPVPHSTCQEVGRAFIMLAPGKSLDEDQLRAFIRERLAYYKVPKSFTFERERPLLPILTVDRPALHRRLVVIRRDT